MPTPCCTVSTEGKALKSIIYASPNTESKHRTKPWESDKLVGDESYAIRWLLETYDPPTLGHIVKSLMDATPSLRVCLSEFALQPAGVLRPDDVSGQVSAAVPAAELRPRAEPVCDPAPASDTFAVLPEGDEITKRSAGGARITLPNPNGHTSCPSVLMFGTKVFYAIEGEGPVEVDITRIGDASRSCTVNYKTKDASAVAGIRYIHTEGTLTFHPDELIKKVSVQILDDDRWDATLEFCMELSEPDNATLCDHGAKCRIKVLDDDAFPTNKYKDLLEAGRVKDIQKIKLFVEYAKANFKDRSIGPTTLKCLAYDQAENLNELLFLVLKLYLVDVVLNMDVSDDHTLMFGMGRHVALAIITCLIICPQTLFCFCNVRRTGSKVGGMCRFKLQANLVRKFLNYGEEVRTSCSHSDLILSITRHSPAVVNQGYLSVFLLIKQGTKLVLLFSYQVVICVMRGQAFSAIVGVVPIVLFPICLYIFLRLRRQKTHMHRLRMVVQEKRLATHIEMVSANARMITDFQRRTRVMDEIEQEVKSLNKEINTTNVVHEVNAQFSPWLESSVVGAYVFLAGSEIIQGGGLSLGAFLTSVDIYRKVASSMEAMYNLVLTVQDTLPALELIVWHMNLPTDLAHRHQMHLKRQALGEAARCRIREGVQARRNNGELVYAVDLLPITLHNVSFTYRQASRNACVHLHDQEPVLHPRSSFKSFCSSFLRRRSLFLVDQKQGSHAKQHNVDSQPEAAEEQLPGISNCSLEIQQGEFVVLAGRRGQGKSTLLKIIGGVHLPDSGDFFVPPHLRIFHVVQTPLFFRCSLLANITYGTEVNHDLARIDRVIKVCQRLHVSDTTLELVLGDQIRNWDEHLSTTQKASLHLARALIANPEVLVVHKPTLCFDDTTAYAVMDAFQTYVRHRGVDIESDPVIRRARTCIITASGRRGCAKADRMYNVEKTRVSEVALDDITDEMFD